MRIVARLEAVVDQLYELACQQHRHCAMAALPDDDDRMAIVETTAIMLDAWQDERAFQAEAHDRPDEVKAPLNRYSSLVADLNAYEVRMMRASAIRVRRLN